MDAWDLEGTGDLRPIGSGINNLSWFVGDRYVLGRYQSTTDLARIAREHRLLAALDAAGLDTMEMVVEQARRLPHEDPWVEMYGDELVATGLL